MTTALEGGERSASRPGRSLSPGKTRYPLYRRLGGPQGRSGQVWKISPPPGFDPQTIQPVASHYTDSTTRPTFNYRVSKNSLCSCAKMVLHYARSGLATCIICLRWHTRLPYLQRSLLTCTYCMTFTVICIIHT